MNILELNHYNLAPRGTGTGISNAHFSLGNFDIYAVKSRLPEDGHLFLKALATLIKPESGTYHYMGRELDFSDYRNLLPFKRKIGYIAPDSALFSNRSIRENLLLMRYYFEDTLNIEIDQRMNRLCRLLGLYDKLDLRPTDLNPLDLHFAVCLREISKAPDLLLVDRPEDYIGHARAQHLKHLFESAVEEGLPVVFLSYDAEFIRTYANRFVEIGDGKLTMTRI